MIRFFLTDSPSLLGVYTKLKAVVAITNSESEQAQLIDESKDLVSDICKDHVAAAQTSVQDPALRESLIKSIESECQELCDYVVATKRFNLEVNARSKDRVISFGEKLSCLFMTALLQDSVRSLLRKGFWAGMRTIGPIRRE